MRNPIGKTGPRTRQTAFGLDSQSDVDRWMSDSPDAPIEISSKLKESSIPYAVSPFDKGCLEPSGVSVIA
jgi:hypothetical protein